MVMVYFNKWRKEKEEEKEKRPIWFPRRNFKLLISIFQFAEYGIRKNKIK